MKLQLGNEKKVTVIIPCYNATKWLPQCFLSLVHQTIGMSALQLIFVNDASTDNGETWEMLQEFERAFPEDILILDLEENCRQGGARNAALSYATGKYIAFVDADDWVEENLFEIAYERARQTDADLVQFNHKLYLNQAGAFMDAPEMPDLLIEIKSDEDRKELLLSERITYGCWNKLYRRAMIEEAGVLYAEHVIYEEPLFVYPLLFWGRRYTLMRERLYIYRQNPIGTMQQDMRAGETIYMHADVQLAVWNFMKQTKYFEIFYEEIKLYFLHTFFFETLYFSRLRSMQTDMKLYAYLKETVEREVPDYAESPYEQRIPLQMRLYRMAQKTVSEEQLSKYLELAEQIKQ